MEKPFKIKSFAMSRETADIMQRAGFEAKSDELVFASLTTLAHFLEEHHLVSHKILENGKLRNGKGFELWSTDLTEQGLAVIRAGLGNWEKKGCPASDIRPLERAYKKVVSGMAKKL
jgi:hypothetical protein